MAQRNENEPTFEQSLSQLEEIVRGIEEGKIGLQEAIDQYEKGMKLVQSCREMLADAEIKIQKLQLADNGRLEKKSMDMPE